MTPGRNDPCHCGSGKKYKKCCEAKDEKARGEALAAEQAALPDTLDPEEAKREKKRADEAARREGHGAGSRQRTQAGRPSRARRRTV